MPNNVTATAATTAPVATEEAKDTSKGSEKEKASKPATKKKPAKKAAKGEAATKKTTAKKKKKAVVDGKKKPAKTAGKARKKNGDKSAERATAKSLGLGLIHYRVLRALAKAGDYLDYRGIEKATGYYSVLAGILHTDEGGKGLVTRKLATTGYFEAENGRTHIGFAITATGRKLLAKAGKSKK